MRAIRRLVLTRRHRTIVLARLAILPLFPSRAFTTNERVYWDGSQYIERSWS